MPKIVPALPGTAPVRCPFSTVVEANGFVFLAGQVGDVPGTHGAVPGGIEAETRAMLDNVGRLLGPSASTTATSSSPRSTCATSPISRPSTPSTASTSRPSRRPGRRSA